jgi:hypothetical protein
MDGELPVLRQSNQSQAQPLAARLGTLLLTHVRSPRSAALRLTRKSPRLRRGRSLIPSSV